MPEPDSEPGLQPGPSLINLSLSTYRYQRLPSEFPVRDPPISAALRCRTAAERNNSIRKFLGSPLPFRYEIGRRNDPMKLSSWLLPFCVASSSLLAAAPAMAHTAGCIPGGDLVTN